MEASFEGGRSAWAEQQSLFSRGPLDQTIGLFRSDLQVLVRQRRIINGRHDGRGHVLPSFQAMKGSVRLQADAANRGIQFLEAPCGAHKCSAGAKPGNEMSDPSGGLLPDFV